MKQLLATLLLTVLGMATAQAAEVPATKASPAKASPTEAPPTEASLKKMFDTMHASSMIDNIWGQMDNMMKASVQQASGGQPLNDTQRAAADDMAAQVSAIFRESMNWDKLEPMMIRVYRKSLTQSEVDGMAKFYASPPGQAMIRKMPVIMQNSMQEMQGMMQEIMPKIQEVARNTQEKIKAAATQAPAKP
jgi:uncharacterized protein